MTLVTENCLLRHDSCLGLCAFWTESPSDVILRSYMTVYVMIHDLFCFCLVFSPLLSLWDSVNLVNFSAALA